MAATTPVCDFGWQAPDFALPDLDGRTVTRDAARGERGLLVVFMCNHCPYVKAIVERLAADARALQASGVGVVGIMSNDSDAYPDDAPERMREFARDHDLPFPYLLDADQSVARAYGAVCTPDFFGFDAQLQLRYRGRLDASRKDTAPAGTPRELYDAMKSVAEIGRGPEVQHHCVGCSIKWRD